MNSVGFSSIETPAKRWTQAANAPESFGYTVIGDFLTPAEALFGGGGRIGGASGISGRAEAVELEEAAAFPDVPGGRDQGEMRLVAPEPHEAGARQCPDPLAVAEDALHSGPRHADLDVALDLRLRQRAVAIALALHPVGDAARRQRVAGLLRRIGAVGVELGLAAGHQPFPASDLVCVAGRHHLVVDEAVLVGVHLELVAPGADLAPARIDLHMRPGLRVAAVGLALPELAAPGPRRLHHGGVDDRHPAFGQDYVLRRELRLHRLEQRREPPLRLQPRPEASDRRRVRGLRIDLQPAEFAEQEVARQLLGQPLVREPVPDPEQQRPQQRLHRIARPSGRLAARSRHRRLQRRPVEQLLQRIERLQRGVVEQRRAGDVIPADTRNKITGTGWKKYQNSPIPDWQNEQWIKEGAFAKGMAQKR